MRMSSLQVMLLLGLYVRGLVAFKVTVCDCSEPLQTGILQFSDEDCRSDQKKADLQPVEYTVYTESRAETKFPGFLCARWKQQKHITTSFFGQKVIVPDKVALDTSPMECWTMYESRRCNEQPMEITENKFVFDQEPAENGWWLSTVVLETINCVVEKIQLFQEIERDTFPTPVGMASAAAGSLSHNHITLVWDKSFTQRTTPRSRLFESGVGSISSLGSSGKLRLHDEGKELEFHLCGSRKAMHERVISTAQYNGWLAASMVRLPKYTKLTAYGKTALAISCKANEVDFSVELSACGPQPKYKNFTINRDGWELVTFAPCYWTTGFVNFNDKPYGYRNKTWYPIEAKILVPQQTLAHSFRYDEVRLFKLNCRSSKSRSHAQPASEMELRGVIQRGRELCNGSCRTRFILINDVMLFVLLSSAGVPNVLIECLGALWDSYGGSMSS
ncbi:hypothetical protein DAPPUDRAFT_118847 [Daphnia pulex]|uniref:Uncharacterized protein n=1 Tax=Daphnia pulex TaxID=6669 RepID=E9HWU5_DAPPU|nr:hypothetical protein DAPPUDRAFT_118847 [Daphnia pulex]|eukprot:EFX63785.1 hypothetical protein DAPPUDRAFT_118847 [Daphnia pulex]